MQQEGCGFDSPGLRSSCVEFAGFSAVHMRPIGSSDLSADVNVSLDGYLCGPVMEWQLVHSFNATWHRLQSNGGIDAID